MAIGRTPSLWVVALKMGHIVTETSAPFSLTRQKRVKKGTADLNTQVATSTSCFSISVRLLKMAMRLR